MSLLQRDGKNVGIWFEEHQDVNQVVGELVANCNPYGTRVWTTKWFAEEAPTPQDAADILGKVHHHFLLVVDTFITNQHSFLQEKSDPPELLLEVIGPNNICGWISSYDVSFHDNNS